MQLGAAVSGVLSFSHSLKTLGRGCEDLQVSDVCQFCVGLGIRNSKLLVSVCNFWTELGIEVP